jgi:hypothetical protein
MSRFRSAGSLYLLATMIALAAVTRSQRVAIAQIPEAPGTYTEPDGNIEHPVELPRGGLEKHWLCLSQNPRTTPLVTLSTLWKGPRHAPGVHQCLNRRRAIASVGHSNAMFGDFRE